MALGHRPRALQLSKGACLSPGAPGVSALSSLGRCFSGGLQRPGVAFRRKLSRAKQQWPVPAWERGASAPSVWAWMGFPQGEFGIWLREPGEFVPMSRATSCPGVPGTEGSQDVGKSHRDQDSCSLFPWPLWCPLAFLAPWAAGDLLWAWG